MCFLQALDWIIPLIFVISIASYEGHDATHLSETRANYLDAIKTMVTASGVALAIVAAGLQQQKLALSGWMLRYAAGWLILCVMLSVVTLLEMSRVYERSPGKVVGVGNLSFALIGFFFLFGSFLTGFTYLARAVFTMTQ